MGKYSGIQSLDKIYDPKNNAFDIVRFILALIVIFSHSFVLLNGSEGDPVINITNYQISAGTIAVNCFFVISGFLITQSLISQKSFLNYLLNRFLRIFPAFFLSLLLIAFILGPLMTNNALPEYFSTKSGSPYEFVFFNLTFNLFGYAWTVRDLFSNTPFVGSANGSMWTLKHEFAMYLSLPILGAFLVLRVRKMMIFLVGTITLLSALNILYGYQLITSGNKFLWVLSSNEYSNFIKLAAYFLFGSLFFLYKDKIIIHPRMIIFFLLITLIGLKTGILNIILLLTLPYITLALCSSFKLSSFRKYGDFSYGLYIYAFPVQQTIVLLFKEKLNVFSFFLFSALITLVLSYFSWHYIEKKALYLKRITWRRNEKKLDQFF
ncbi:acyltransferase family protein [Paenibacillus sp. MAEPY2]|uniref:acyltransferase family protein n=2 Tax=unclassified Paenibacillus TaxID=185978 RepID=UPI0003F7FAE3|nr:acyltransferase [Paenibacillus sp. MAEPY2]KGP80827.1 hypothetical protein P364_0117805 [Paenibacillus sp. MAEPY2]